MQHDSDPAGPGFPAGPGRPVPVRLDGTGVAKVWVWQGLATPECAPYHWGQLARGTRMTLEQLLRRIADVRGELSGMGIARLAVFGSFARNEATDASDIDLLVEFSHPVGLFEFARVRRNLSELLGREVDLVTFAGLRKEIRERVLRESVHAA